MRQYQELAFRTAWAITGSAADAEDAAQEAFVKAYYALPHFRPGAPLRPWLLRIVANQARNQRKALSRRDRRQVAWTDHVRGAEPWPAPEAIALASERRARLLQALGELTAPDRDVITCRYFLDLTEPETADVLRCARGTVKSRLSRAIARLRQRLGGSLDDEAPEADHGKGATHG